MPSGAGNGSQHRPDALLETLRRLEAISAYERGVIDTLRLLGLVVERDGGATATGTIARYILHSLWAHLNDGVAIGIDWETAPVGLALLRAMETIRIAVVPNPTPAREAVAAQAIIKSRQGAEDAYLMEFDAEAGQYQPIGGKQESDEDDPTETLRREIAEELGLGAIPGPDDCRFHPLEMAWRVTRLSATYGVLTRYTFNFYHLTEIAFPLPTDADTCWLSRREVLADQADDGRPVSSLYREAIGAEWLDSLDYSV
jgi:8-oxo-dGTP pyrophosphatase MutT (NUDIX family)